MCTRNILLICKQEKYKLLTKEYKTLINEYNLLTNECKNAIIFIGV